MIVEHLTGLKTIGSNVSPNFEAETSVLGAVLLEPAVMDEIHHMLEPRDFSIESHKLIWQAMQHKYSRNEPIDLVTVTEVLHRYKRLDEVGGLDYLQRLASSVPTAANAAYYAEIIQRYAYRKRGLEAANEIIRIAENGDFEDIEEYFQEIENAVTAIRPKTNGNMKHISEVRDEFIRYLQEKDDFVNTGFRRFDDWSGGIGRGWLYVLAGRPSVGKTAKAIQMGANIAKQNQGAVLIFSQEMPRNQILARMISPITGVNYNRIRQKKLDADEFKRVVDTFDKLSDMPIHVEDTSGMTIEEIRAIARNIKRRYGQIGAIIVDYLQIMNIPVKYGETRSQAVGRVSRTAKQIALELHCPFILLSQLNREGADEPRLEHLRDSGEIEQDADIVELLWHDPEEESHRGKVIQSKIAKGRDVGTNNFKYIFAGWIQKYEDYE